MKTLHTKHKRGNKIQDRKTRIAREIHLKTVTLASLCTFFLLLGSFSSYIIYTVWEKADEVTDKRIESDMAATLDFMKETFRFDPTTFIHPDSAKIKKLASTLKSTENIYDYVKQNVKYDPNVSAPSDIVTLETKKSSCFGFSALVASLLRANGSKPDDVHVLVAKLKGADSDVPPHAWVEVRDGDGWTVIDPTNFVSRSFFSKRRLIVPKEEYLALWPKANLLFEYNDEYFKYDIGI